MIASELIKKLSQLIAQHGDLEVERAAFDEMEDYELPIENVELIKGTFLLS